ncbi:MAG: hypothetical protein ACI4TD_10975 [Phocaeicola sp.]
MARQIVDLPRIDLADLADDDLLIIRDSNARKDKRITVGDLKAAFFNDTPEDFIGTENIKNLAVTGAKIAGSTIGKSKINWRDMPSRKFEFYTTDADSEKIYSVTSPRGNKYTLKLINGGTGLFVVSGGSKIVAYTMYVARKFTTAVSGNYGLQGLKANTTAYTRVFGRENNGSASTMSQSSAGTGSVSYTDLGGAIGGAKKSTEAVISGVKFGSIGNSWRLFGKAGSSGTLSCLSFEAEMTATDDNTVPTFYQIGANTSNSGDGFIFVEFVEGD